MPSLRNRVAGVALAAAMAAAATPAAADQPVLTEPHIELVTMGWGPMIYHRYGHGALCVVYKRNRRLTTCFNYGTTDFSVPVAQMGWTFLRGTAKFWVEPQSYGEMMRLYKHYDRSIWVQRLPLTEDQVAHMVRLLENDLLEENKYYVYHHFDDNCTTRLRDHIDEVTGGALREGSDVGVGLTFREIGRNGIADLPPLIIVAHFMLGRRLDHEATLWEAMFHPDYLRQQVADRLGAEPRQVYERNGPVLAAGEGSWGFGWVLLLALVLALPVAVTWWLGRLERAALALSSGVLTLVALIVWFVAVVTTIRELRVNEALLVFWPTDFLLAVLRGDRRRRYAQLRLIVLMVVSALLAVGIFIQPLLVLVLLPATVCFFPAMGPRKDSPSPQPALAHGPPGEREQLLPPPEEGRVGVGGDEPA